MYRCFIVIFAEIQGFVGGLVIYSSLIHEHISQGYSIGYGAIIVHDGEISVNDDEIPLVIGFINVLVSELGKIEDLVYLDQAIVVTGVALQEDSIEDRAAVIIFGHSLQSDHTEVVKHQYGLRIVFVLEFGVDAALIGVQCSILYG